MDQLTLDCIAARKAGMTYGKWKALQPVGAPVAVVEIEPEEVPKRAVRTCKNCGREVPAIMHGSVKYCSIDCKYEIIRIKQRDYYRRKRERESNGKV